MKWLITILIFLAAAGILVPVILHKLLGHDEFDASKDLFI